MLEYNQPNRLSKRNKIIISVVSIIFVVIITILILSFLNKKKETKPVQPTENKVMTDESKTDTSEKSDKTTDSKTEASTVEKEKNLPKEYEGNIAKNDITGVINFKSVVGNNLVIRTTFDQLLSSGTCDLTLTNSAGKTVKKTANIIANPSSSSCMGFDVPVAELGKGEWNIELIVKSGDLKSTLNEKVNL